MKGMFNISRLYLKKYKLLILLLVFIFFIIGVSKGTQVKNNLRSGAISFKLNKDNDYNSIDFLVDNSYDFWKKHNEKFDEISNTKDIKISIDELEILKNNIAIDNLLIGKSYSNNNIYYYEKDFEKRNITKYLTKEQKENIYKLNLIQHLSNELKIYKDKDLSSAEKEAISETENQLKELIKDARNTYPLYINSYNSNQDLSKLIDYNLDNNGLLSVKEYYYTPEIMLFLLLGSIAIVTLIFGLEYHTNFGKFVASLPYKKTTIYFSKFLTSSIIFVLCHTILALTAVWTFKTSVVSELVSLSSAFIAYGKIHILAFFIIILGAIFASFSGSVLSIIGLYLPGMLFLGYPVILYYFIIKNTTRNLENIDNLARYLFEVDNPLFIPARIYFDGYFSMKYYFIYGIILFILLVISSKIYKYHNIDDEGRLFTNNIMKWICYFIALVSFVIVFAAFIFTLNINLIVSYIISFLVMIPLIYAIFNLKIRI